MISLAMKPEILKALGIGFGVAVAEMLYRWFEKTKLTSAEALIQCVGVFCAAFLGSYGLDLWRAHGKQ